MRGEEPQKAGGGQPLTALMQGGGPLSALGPRPLLTHLPIPTGSTAREGGLGLGASKGVGRGKAHLLSMHPLKSHVWWHQALADLGVRANGVPSSKEAPPPKMLRLAAPTRGLAGP